MKKKRIGIYIILTITGILAVIGISLMSISNYVVKEEKSNIIEINNLGEIQISKSENIATNRQIISKNKKEIDRLKKLKPQCIMILGAGIKDKETPTSILKERLDTGIRLYKMGIAPKILLTGDNGTREHNEIHVMLKYTLEHGVKKKDIFCDHAGFNTSNSINRSKKIFGVERMVIVTQKYHEYRSLYMANKLGIKAIGVPPKENSLKGQWKRQIREVLARNKDVFLTMIHQDSSLGGETFDIAGDGELTYGE